MTLCEHCGRELESLPNAMCPAPVHWRAWSEALSAQVEAMRTALETIATVTEYGEGPVAWSMWARRKARDALATLPKREGKAER